MSTCLRHCIGLRCPICDAPRQLCPDCYEQDTDCTCQTEDQP